MRREVENKDIWGRIFVRRIQMSSPFVILAKHEERSGRQWHIREGFRKEFQEYLQNQILILLLLLLLLLLLFFLEFKSSNLLLLVSTISKCHLCPCISCKSQSQRSIWSKNFQHDSWPMLNANFLRKTKNLICILLTFNMIVDPW